MLYSDRAISNWRRHATGSCPFTGSNEHAPPNLPLVSRGLSSSTLVGSREAVPALMLAKSWAAEVAMERLGGAVRTLASCSASVVWPAAAIDSEASPAAIKVRSGLWRTVGSPRELRDARQAFSRLANAGPRQLVRNSKSSAYRRARRPSRYPTKSAPATVTIGRARIEALAASVSCA